MMSLSHWGMFEVEPPPVFVVPAGFKIADLDRALKEWKRPDGFIELVRDYDRT